MRGTVRALTILLLVLFSSVLVASFALSRVSGQSAAVTGVGPWTEQNNYGSPTTIPGEISKTGVQVLGVSCVTYTVYVYCVGGQNATGTDLSDVFYTQLFSNGSIGAWTETTDYGASSGTSGSGGVGVEWSSCVVYNAYIYCVGGATGTGILSKVFFAQLSASGVGPWTEATDYGASSGTTGSGGVDAFQLACVVDTSYIYCVGGSTSKVFFAQISATGVGPWTETIDYGASSGTSGTGGLAIGSNACVDNAGYIYCIGGTVAFKPVSDTFYAPVSSAGVGAWIETTDYGAASGTTGTGGEPIYGTNCVVYNSYVICIAGDTTGNAGTAHIYYDKDQAFGSWETAADYVGRGYWDDCVELFTYIYCFGNGSDQAYSAPIQPTTVSSTTSSSTTTSSTTLISTTSTASPSTESSTSTSSSTTIPIALSSETSTSTTTTPVQSSVSSSSTTTVATTTTPVPVSNNDTGIAIGIVIAILLVTSSLFVYRRRTGGGKRPPPPPTTERPPPPPSKPPPPNLVTPPQEIPGECASSVQWEHLSMNIAVYPDGNTYSASAANPQTGARTFKKLSDDPLPIRADSVDLHRLIQLCKCPGKSGDESKRYHNLKSQVKFNWEIVSGEGGFIKINDDVEAKSAVGAEVLYQPPDITKPRPLFNPPEVKKVIMRVTASHDDSTKSPVNHEPVHVDVIFEIMRQIEDLGGENHTAHEFTDPGRVEDYYVYNWWVSGEGFVQTPIPPREVIRSCIPEHEWMQGSPIAGSIVLVPEKCAYGDFVRFEATATDSDDLELRCNASGEACRVSAIRRLTIHDNLVYEWSATKGVFANDRGHFYNREVIWHAPDEEGLVKITLVIRNDTRYSQFNDAETKLEAEIYVQKMGVDLVKTPNDWLPLAQAGQLQPLSRTYLCSGGKWAVGGRKKFYRFRLTHVLREPGVCMNYPTSANKNPDLFFYEERMDPNYLFVRDQTESGAGTHPCVTHILSDNDNPEHRHHYMIAVAKQRTIESRPDVRCEDYGARGYIEAEAHHCASIPPRASEISEPCDGKDCCEGPNIVKIPRDDNGNDMPDFAPVLAPQDKLPDGSAAHSNSDLDNTPEGNGTNGDGLTNYEEYRGFIVVALIMMPGGVGPTGLPVMVPTRIRNHVRTSANRKTILVHVMNDELLTGANFFSSITNIDVNFVTYGPDEVDQLYKRGAAAPSANGLSAPVWTYGDDNMVVNYNRCSDASHTLGKVYGLVILRDNGITAPLVLLFGISIERTGAPRTNGPPSFKDCIKINIPNLHIGAGLLGVNEGALSNRNVAHEMAHAVNCWHHGALQATHSNALHGVCTCVPPYHGSHMAEIAGRVASGDVDCIMRYPTPRCGWCHDFHTMVVVPFTGQPTGNTLCAAATGTGLNDNHGVTNNSTWPNYPSAPFPRNPGCRGQIWVSDPRP